MKKATASIFLSMVVLLLCCSPKRDWKNPLDPANDAAPGNPSIISPRNGEQYADTAVQFVWSSCKDPNPGDSIRYNVLLDINNPPAITAAADLHDTTYFTAKLHHGTTYYVKIVARDNHNVISESPVTTIHTFYNYREVGFYDTPGMAYDVAISGSYAYIADQYSMRTISISNPAAPVEAGFCTITGYATAIDVAGNYAYVTSGNNRILHVIDISSPSSPSEVGTIPTGSALDVKVSGDFVFVSNDAENDSAILQIFNVSNPSLPQEVGHLNMHGFASHIFISDSLLYLMDWGVGMRIINISNPAAPHVIGNYLSHLSAIDVTISGKYAYINDGYGFQVVDISNPGMPSGVGSLSFQTGYSIVHYGNFVLLPAYGKLYIVDVSNPAMPIAAGECALPLTDSRSAVVSGKYAYIVCQEAGLRVIQIAP